MTFVDSQAKPSSTDEIYVALEDSTARNYSILRTVYFLCLSKPRSQQELSQIIYDGRIQLSRINLAIDQLEKVGYIKRVVKTREEMRRLGFNPKANLWESSFDPLLKSIVHRYYEFKKEIVEPKEIETIYAILNSEWFKTNFLNDRFPELMLGRGTDLIGNMNSFEGEIDRRYSEYLEKAITTKKFSQVTEKVESLEYEDFASSIAKQLGPYKSVVVYNSLKDIRDVLGDIATPKKLLPENMQKFIDLKLSVHRTEIIKIGFDKFLADRKDKFSDKFAKEIEKIKTETVDYLGDKEAIDFYFKDFATFVLPRSTANILFYAGRISSIVWPISNAIKEINFEGKSEKELEKYLNLKQ